jgi:hypothetical protein
MCDLVSENDGNINIIEEWKYKYEDACSYADELADELAKYNSNIPVRQTSGRHFRV